MNKLILASLGVLSLAACAPSMTSTATTGTTGASDTSTSASTSATSSTGTTGGTLSQPSATLNLTRQPTAPATVLAPIGSVMKTTAADGKTGSMVALSGLAPSTYYVAHYHLQGTAGADPCASGGPPILASMIVGQSDAGGKLSMMGSVDSAVIKDATYFNVHTAKDATGAPADAGVACAPLGVTR